MEDLYFTVENLAAILIIGVTSILTIYWYSTRNHSYWKSKGIPYVKPYPFLGSSYEALTKKMPMGDEIFTKALTVVSGEDWKRIRSLVSPTFSTGKIKKTIGIFKSCAQTAVHNFKIYAEKGEPVEAKRVYGCYTMDVIASSAFSTKIDSHNDPDNNFLKHAKLAFSGNFNWKFLLFVLFPRVAQFFKISFVHPTVKRFFCNTINGIIEERKTTGQTKNDFLQLLLDTAKEVKEDEERDSAGNESKDIAENYGKDDALEYIMKNKASKKHLSFNELVAQCLLFFLVGYETTATTLSFVTCLLALNQDAQDKVRAEIDQAIEDNNGELTYEAIQSMKYLDNVISETLRLYPPLVRIERTSDEDYKLGNTGITVSKGMIVTIPIYAIHRDPDNYPDPEKFSPERFSAEERAKRDPYTYLPFGLGPRNCVAMRFALLEVKVCLAYVISNFIIKKSPLTKFPLEFRAGLSLLQPKEIIVAMELKKDRPSVK